MTAFLELSPVVQGTLATLFTWFVTALGASLVFFFRTVNQKVLDAMLGFGAGVMIAASFWSLLNPAIALAEELGGTPWLYPALGFAFGGLFIVAADILLDRALHDKTGSDREQSLKRSILLVTAVTLHNIPEGLAVGVAFGGAALHIEGMELVGAISLAFGIALQNFPEGAAVSLPLRRDGYSRGKSFLIGQASGIVEPIAGALGAYAALSTRALLPLLLSFAAGAMIGVVASELIPESAKQNKRLSTIGLICGFIVMMILDVALG